MAILLIVLKIIGIILLILLGLIVFVFCLVLFVPVRYEFKGKFTDTYDFSLGISWLLKIVSFRVMVQNKTITNRISVFGIRLKKKEKVKAENDESIFKNDKDLQEKNKSVENIMEEPKEDIEGHSINQNQCFKQKKGIFTKIKEAILSFVRKIKQTIEKIYDTIKTTKDKLQKVDAFLHDEKNQMVFNLCKKEIFYLLHHYKPRKWKGNLRLGTGDPATTGYALGTLCALYPVHGGNLIVSPDFDNKVIEGNVFLKGRIRGVHVMRTIVHLFMNKSFRNMILKNNGGKSNGGK